MDSSALPRPPSGTPVDEVEEFDAGKTLLTAHSVPARAEDLLALGTKGASPPKAEKQEGEATLCLVAPGGLQKFHISPEQLMVSIGNSREQNKVVINDPDISDKQLVILNIDNEWVLLDCGVHDLVEIDGVRRRQYTTSLDSRLVVKIGRTYAVFLSKFGTMQNTSTMRLKKQDLRNIKEAEITEGDAKLTVSMNSQSKETRSAPILIGKDSSCDFVINDPSVQPFHVMIYWGVGGIFIEPLGEFPFSVNREEFSERQELKDGDQVIVGHIPITIRITGDCAAHCRDLFDAALAKEGSFTLSALANSESDSVAITTTGTQIQVGKPLSIGRSEAVDITLDDTSVSRDHAQIIPSGKTFMIIDNYSHNGTFVNGERVNKARVRAGDIIELGNSYFLVHYY